MSEAVTGSAETVAELGQIEPFLQMNTFAMHDSFQLVASSQASVAFRETNATARSQLFAALFGF